MMIWKSIRSPLLAIALGSFSVLARADVANLAWDASPDSTVTGYRVYSAPASTSSFSRVLDTSALEASISNPGSLVGYRFYITALNAQGGESDPSNTLELGPRLQYNLAYGSDLSLSWNVAGFALQSAPTVQGPWTTRATSSPARINPNGPPQFFRLVKN